MSLLLPNSDLKDDQLAFGTLIQWVILLRCRKLKGSDDDNVYMSYDKYIIYVMSM